MCEGEWRNSVCKGRYENTATADKEDGVSEQIQPLQLFGMLEEHRARALPQHCKNNHHSWCLSGWLVSKPGRSMEVWSLELTRVLPPDVLLGSGQWHNIWDKNLGDGLAFMALQWSEVQGQTNDLRQWVFTGRGFGAKGYTGRYAALSSATATDEFQWRDGKDRRIGCCMWGREKWNSVDFPVLGNEVHVCMALCAWIVCMALKSVIGLRKCSFAD